MPQSTTHESKYAITWSPEGVINEYLNDALILHEGDIKKVRSLDGYEKLIINGTEYEAFYTSGGCGTLLEEFEENISTSVNYKTLRYVGHWEYMKKFFNAFFVFEGENVRDEMVKDFKNLIPKTKQDKVVVYIEVSGIKNSEYVVQHWQQEFHPYNGYTAIEISTAAGMLVWLDYLKQRGIENQKAFTKQEDMPFEFFEKSFASIINRLQDVDKLKQFR